MKLIDVLMAPRRAAEAKRLRERQQETRVPAYEDALALCEAIGPYKLAFEYALPQTLSDEDLALAFARAAYNREAVVMAAAGAAEGFERWWRTHATPPVVVPDPRS